MKDKMVLTFSHGMQGMNLQLDYGNRHVRRELILTENPPTSNPAIVLYEVQKMLETIQREHADDWRHIGN